MPQKLIFSVDFLSLLCKLYMVYQCYGLFVTDKIAQYYFKKLHERIGLKPAIFYETMKSSSGMYGSASLGLIKLENFYVHGMLTEHGEDPWLSMFQIRNSMCQYTTTCLYRGQSNI